MFGQHPDFDSFVLHHWRSFPTVGGMRGFYDKLSNLKKHLRQWNRDIVGNIFDALELAEAETTRCEQVYDSSPSDDTRAAYHLSMTQLKLAQSRALAFWKQKAM